MTAAWEQEGLSSTITAALLGVNGREYGYLDENSNLEGVVKPAEGGKTIVPPLM